MLYETVPIPEGEDEGRTRDRGEREAYEEAQKVLTRLQAEADSLKVARTKATVGALLDYSRSLLLVDTNEQAARLPAALRAELVRLGHVHNRAWPWGCRAPWPGSATSSRLARSRGTWPDTRATRAG